MKVFISYRRDDTPDLAGRIADRLRQWPAFRDVFFDVDVIAHGANFAASIRHALAARPACIVLIGKKWCGPQDKNRSRIFSADDWVRVEVTAMLEEKLQIIPVLAEGASMPRQADLPVDLQPLTRLNALRVRHENFQQDMATLANSLLGHPPREAKSLSVAFRGFFGLFLGLLAILGAAFIHQIFTGNSLNDRMEDGAVVLLLFAFPIAGAIIGIWTAIKK